MRCESCGKREISHLVTFRHCEPFAVCEPCATVALLGTDWSAANPVRVERVDLDAPIALIPTLLLVR